jgi:hypothetical protein
MVNAVLRETVDSGITFCQLKRDTAQSLNMIYFKTQFSFMQSSTTESISFVLNSFIILQWHFERGQNE